jgi:hypothetical protein
VLSRLDRVHLAWTWFLRCHSSDVGLGVGEKNGNSLPCRLERLGDDIKQAPEMTIEPPWRLAREGVPGNEKAGGRVGKAGGGRARHSRRVIHRVRRLVQKKASPAHASRPFDALDHRDQVEGGEGVADIKVTHKKYRWRAWLG